MLSRRLDGQGAKVAEAVAERALHDKIALAAGVPTLRHTNRKLKSLPLLARGFRPGTPQFTEAIGRTPEKLSSP
jgi:hypothetical protein